MSRRIRIGKLFQCELRSPGAPLLWMSLLSLMADLPSKTGLSVDRRVYGFRESRMQAKSGTIHSICSSSTEATKNACHSVHVRRMCRNVLPKSGNFQFVTVAPSKFWPSSCQGLIEPLSSKGDSFLPRAPGLASRVLLGTDCSRGFRSLQLGEKGRERSGFLFGASRLYPLPIPHCAL